MSTTVHAPKFGDMPYERPDLGQIKVRSAALAKALASAKDYEEAKRIFVEKDTFDKHLQTMQQLASIRYTIDTRDPFYKEEQDFWNAAQPQIEEAFQPFTDALLKSPFRAEFTRDYGKVLFLNEEIRQRAFSPEIVPDMQEENRLVNEYETLLAKARVSFEGNLYTIPQMALFKSDPEDGRRLAAWKAEAGWYKDHQATLDELYDRLVHLRDKMGRRLGYDNYIPLGYDRMGRNCYTKDDVETFRAAVVKYIVPIADKIYRRQAERIGKSYPMSFADNELEFRSGNPRPSGSADDILRQGLKFYTELSPETGEFFQTMLDHDLLDVLSKEGKQGGGYCTGLYDYGLPFIFANFSGTLGDVSVVTHEAGHAFAYYMNRDRVPASESWPSMEGCEVHSMSMEFFAWPWAEGFFGKDTRKFYYSHLAEALTFIPYGTMVDHFQHEVYEHPDYTPAQRHGIWKKLLGLYMPWEKLDGDIPFYSEGQGWQRQHHIYSMPFYYIDYCLAQTVSLEFWAMIQKDPKDAWKHYMAYTVQGGSAVFTDLLKNAGLRSPFDEACLRGVAQEAGKWLEDFDLSGIR